MTHKEINNFQHLAVTNITDESITLTYDLGDAQDVERFENKFDNILNHSDIKAYLEVSLDQSEFADTVDEWSVVDVVIEYANISLNELESFIHDVDAI